MKTTLERSSRNKVFEIAPASTPESKRKTHRCRLFEVEVSDKISGTRKCYTEVWDTLEKPFNARDLPGGKVMATKEDFSRNRLREMMEETRKRLGILDAGFWSGHAT